MTRARRPAPRGVPDPEAFVDPERELYLDETPSPGATAAGTGGLSVCLACGLGPGARGDCPHAQVAVFDHGSGALHLAVRKLQELSEAKRQAERALLRLVERALERGEAALDAQPASFVTTPQGVSEAPTEDGEVPAASEAPCPHCGRPAAPARALVPRRGKRPPEAQGLFAFARVTEATVATVAAEDVGPRVVPLEELEGPPRSKTRGRRRGARAGGAQGDGSSGQLK
ncbi:MAG: hypothetical protein HY909_05855 [Deltaproteobacteria bacterium]|nr:hypothetical protein [Deltaproteobacteria bacterium]